MHVTCEKCRASIQVDESRLPPNRQVSCPVCAHQFSAPLPAPAGLRFNASASDDGDAVIELPAPLVTPPPAARGAAGTPPLVTPPPAGMPMPGGPLVTPPPDLADLPAPVRPPPGGSAGLPPPRPQPVDLEADLPAPAARGSARGGLPGDLPAPIAPRGDLVADLPAPVSRKDRTVAGSAELPAPVGRSASGGPSGGVDLPGLPNTSAGAGRTIQGRPPPLSSLPPAAGTPDFPPPSPPPSSPAAGSGVPDDLPAPKVGRLDLADFDLSAAPSGPIDEPGLPVPRGIMDLPAPAEVVDLPQPSSAGAPPLPPDLSELPMPSPGIDLPMPTTSGGAAFDEISLSNDSPVPGIDLGGSPPSMPNAPGSQPPLPPSLSTDLPGGTIDLPQPAQGAGGLPSPGQGGFDVPMPLDAAADADAVELPAGIIDLPRPIADQPLASDVVIQPPPPGELAQPAGAGAMASAASGRGAIGGRRLPLIVGGGVGIVVLLVVALGAVLGWFGGNDSADGPTGAKTSAAAEIAAGRAALAQDSHKGYLEAEKRFRAAVKATKEDQRAIPEALVAQAILFRDLRFGPSRRQQREAEDLLLPHGALEEPPAELLMARALLEASKKPTMQSAEALEKLADTQPKNAQAAVYLGWALIRAKKPAPAMGAFKRAMAAEPKSAAAAFGLAQANALLNKPELASKWAKAALAANTDHASAWLLQGRLQLSADDPAAEASLKRAATLASAPKEKSEAQALLGSIAAARGEANVARDRFTAALELDPESTVALVGLGRQLLHAGKPLEAMQHFTNARKTAPKDIDAGLLLAEAQIALDRQLDARKTVEDLIASAPQSARVKTAMAELENTAGASKKAIKLYRAAIELDPRQLQPYVGLSRVYLREKRSSEAFAALKQASSMIKGAAVRNAMGEVHLQLGQVGQARSRFEEALAIDPKLNAALFNLARALHAQENLPAALEKFRELQERDAAYPQLAANLGQLLLDMGEPTKAAESFERALTVDRPATRLRLAAGKAFIAAGEFKKALAQADLVLKEVESSTLSPALALRAQAHMGLNELGEALMEIGRALNRDQRSQFFVIQARIQERLKRPLDALESLAAAIKLDPKRTDLRLERGRLLVRAGTVKDGLKELEEVIAVQPDLAQAHLFSGIAYSDLGNKAAAVAALKRALKLDDALGEAHFRLGQIHFDRGQMKPAYAYLKDATARAAESDRWRAEATYMLAQVAMRQKRRKEAIEAFQAFLEIASVRDAGRAVAKKALAELGVKPQ